MAVPVYGAADRAYALVPTAVQTANYAANANDLVLVNTASAQTTTLPTAPPDRTLVAVKIVAGSNAVTVNTGGTDVFDVAGGAATMNWNVLYQAVTYQYVSATGVWVRVSSYGTASGGGAVSSVFGRTGAVVAAANDYAFSQISGTAAIAQGGTGQTTQQAALDALAGATTSGLVLRGNGTHVTLAAIQAADVPTLNQNTSGTAAGLSTTLAVASGGTGQTTALAAFNALSPLTTLGDILTNDGTNDVRVAGNTTTTRKFLIQTGNGTVSAAPAWGTIVNGDIPTLNQNTTGTASNVTGTVAVAHGGTGHTIAPVTSTGATTVTGVTVATLLASGLTVPISSLAAGQKYSFEAWGVLSTTVDTQTFTLNLNWGGLAGTSIMTWGASNPNGSATVTNGSWAVEFTIVANTATSLSVSGKLYMNYYFSSYQQQVTTVANTSTEQFVLAVTPSATAASITCNGFVSERNW